MKIARRHRVPWLARDAWFYDEMEYLQGSVLPYCYGWFEMELGRLVDNPGSSQYFVKALDDHSVDIRRGEDVGLDFFEGQEMHPMLAERASRNDIISILILEHVGGMMPLGRPVTEDTEYVF